MGQRVMKLEVDVELKSIELKLTGFTGDPPVTGPATAYHYHPRAVFFHSGSAQRGPGTYNASMTGNGYQPVTHNPKFPIQAQPPLHGHRAYQ